MRTLPPSDPWLSPQQAAYRLRVSVRTLTAYAKAGRIGYVLTPSGRRLYPLSAVNAAIQREGEPK